VSSTRKTVVISAETHAALKRQAAKEDVSLTDAAATIVTGPRIIYCDAGTRNNGRPGQWSVMCLHDGEQVLQVEVLGNRTNNEAEILAIARAIEEAGDTPTTIRSDSKLAVNMVTGVWPGSKRHLQELVAEIEVPEHIEIEWIPRDDNPAGWHLEEKYRL
jgi:ribonuclease HI